MRSTRFVLLLGLAVASCSGCERTPQGAVAGTSRPAIKAPTEEQPTRKSPQPAPPKQLQAEPGEFTTVAAPKREPCDLNLVSLTVGVAPALDGRTDDEAWSSAAEVSTLDRSSQREIRIKSVHTADELFLLVTVPDAAPSESHKTWVWDPQEGIYKQGQDREDALVFKWSMSGNDANLSLFTNPQPHNADIWFWKACRTNPAGYADDKQQMLSTTPDKRSRHLQLANGRVLYLVRSGDEGSSAYDERLVYDYMGDTVRRFLSRQPEGSRGDVRAKGGWRDGHWTIEFARKLNTGHADDLAFERGRSYLFGISCYEMSFDDPAPEWTQPLYRTGDVYDRILLTIR